MSETTKSEIVVERTEREAPFMTRLHLYASKFPAAADLTVSKELSGRWSVRWSVSRGNAWGKARKAIAETEAQARAIADQAWAKCLAWLERVAPEAPLPAAAYFEVAR